jgi:leucyl aminopeptidase (aminopeptidase T)
VLETIKKDEDLLVRELGFGLNPAMGKDRMIPDINAFERQQGVHLSIGAKHAIYAKPGLSRKHGRYHVDIFVDVTDITIDGESVFTNGAFK